MSARPSLADFQNAQVQPESAATTKKSKANLKEELIQTSFRLPRSRWKKLQELAIDQRTSVQAVLIESLEDVFSKKGLKF